MPSITVKIDTTGAFAKLTGLEKQVNFATAKALTQTAGDVPIRFRAALADALATAK